MNETETKSILTLDELESLMTRNVTTQVDPIKASIVKLSESFDASQKSLTDALAKLDKPAEVAEPATLSESGVLSGAMDWEILDIPVGGIVVGGISAIFLTELVDGFMTTSSSLVRGGIKLGISFASAKWGGKVFGKEGGQVIALLVGFDALANDIIPGLFDLGTKAANKLTGTVTTRGLGHTGSRGNNASLAMTSTGFAGGAPAGLGTFAGRVG